MFIECDDKKYKNHNDSVVAIFIFQAMGEVLTQDGNLAEELLVHLALPQRAPLMDNK